MDLQLKGHRVIITGAADGIGLVVARAFQEEGAQVVVCDVSASSLEQLRVTDPNITGAQCNVTDRTQVKQFMEDAITGLGGLDTLINNAGVAGPTGPVEDIDADQWDTCLDVCLTGQFNVTRHAVSALKASENASIINMASLAARVGFGFRTPYAAAKWGVVGFTKSLSIELGSDGIRANAILPGLVAGDRQRHVLEAKAQRFGVSFDEMEARAFSYTSIQDYVTPQQLADQILLLASVRGRSISGQAISVCGDTQMLA